MALNKETGEITEDDEIIIRHGDQEVHTTGEGLKQAADGLSEARHLQLALFEGHKIDKLETKLKAATIDIEDIDPQTKIPRLYQRKYFLVSARVLKVQAAHKDDKDEGEILVKTVIFDVDDANEVDEITAKRLLKDKIEA